MPGFGIGSNRFSNICMGLLKSLIRTGSEISFGFVLWVRFASRVSFCYLKCALKNSRKNFRRNLQFCPTNYIVFISIFDETGKFILFVPSAIGKIIYRLFKQTYTYLYNSTKTSFFVITSTYFVGKHTHSSPRTQRTFKLHLIMHVQQKSQIASVKYDIIIIKYIHILWNFYFPILFATDKYLCA